MTKKWNAGFRTAALVAGLVALGAAGGYRADEGMWLYERPPLELLKERHGFEPPPGWMDHLRLSSVNVYASASFVSPDGLILTNHHVALSSVQRLSTPEHNYVRDGFYAATREAEIPIPGLAVKVLVSIEDVTSRVEAAAAGAPTPQQALKKREAAIAALEAECLKNTGLKGEVVALFGGARYHLYRYREYTDVRLVFAPELQAAFFGGDSDNFTYPRYDLDFAFLRAYENGQPARVDHYLKVNPAGTKEGDLVFVSGHPGRTDRLATLDALRYYRDVTFPHRLEDLRHREALLTAYSERGAEEARRARTYLYFLANSKKANEGEFAGLNDPALMERKRQAEESLRKAVEADPALAARYASAWTELEKAYAWARDHEKERRFLAQIPGGNWGSLPGAAISLVLYDMETRKPDADRLPGYHEAELPALLRNLKAPRPTYKDMEELLLADDLARIREGLGASHPYVQALLGGREPQEVAREVIQGTRLDSAEFRASLLQKKGKALASSQDPLLLFARKAEPFLRANRLAFKENLDAVEEEAYTRIAQAGFAVYGERAYPDATGTLRLAFGVVSGYPFATTLVPPFTTFYGLYDRAYSFGDKGEFVLTARERERRDRVRLETPLNFVCTADITGGNSGSPVVDREGRLVGLVFDGNAQSHPNTFVYDEAQARCVAVDIRGILEALDKLYDAHPLVEEMVKASP